NGLGAKEVVVPNREQAHEHWQVALERSRTKVLVHLMEAIQHGSEILLANRQHRRKTDRRIHRVAAANPVPESEHIGWVDTELRHLRRVRRYRDEVLGDGPLVTTE